MTTWTAPLFEFIISSAWRRHFPKWPLERKEALGKYCIQCVGTGASLWIVLPPTHFMLSSSSALSTSHFITWYFMLRILVQGVHFFTLKYNNFSEMGSYRSYRTYLNFPHHGIEMKQHFRNKFYILSAKHYNKQFGSKCEKFISVYWSLINDIWPQESANRFGYDGARTYLAYRTFQ